MPLNRNIIAIFVIFSVVFLIIGNAAAADRWGVIAYSGSDDIWGYSYNYRTERKAEQEALTQCRNSGGRNCTIYVTILNGCGAFAVGGNRGGGGSGINRRTAERNALKSCRKETSNCTVRVWFCNSR